VLVSPKEAGMAAPISVEDYLAALPEAPRAALEKLRKTIKAAAPEAVIEALGDELKPYFTGKGTIRFHADKPLPAALVNRIVKVRLEENAAHRRG